MTQIEFLRELVVVGEFRFSVGRKRRDEDIEYRTGTVDRVAPVLVQKSGNRLQRELIGELEVTSKGCGIRLELGKGSWVQRSLVRIRGDARKDSCVAGSDAFTECGQLGGRPFT